MFKHILVTLLFAFSTFANADQLISVKPEGAGFFTPATNVIFWENPNAIATVAHLPGGTGSFNVTQLWPREKVHSFGSILTQLLDKDLSSAYIDSPYSLGGYDLSARRGEDHLSRVASAVRTIYQKTNKPIWLFGHSNGAVSATEVYTYLKQTNEQQMIGGLILSSSRNETSVPGNINVPVLFMHHKDDGCQHTLYQLAQQHYIETKAINGSRTEFATITSTFNPKSNPCYAGAHMYENNYAEIAKTISEFIKQ